MKLDSKKAVNMHDEQTRAQSVIYQANQEAIDAILNPNLTPQEQANIIMSIIDHVAWSECARGYDHGYREGHEIGYSLGHGAGFNEGSQYA